MDNDTLLLAIDTTTDQSGVALYDGTCLDEISWTSCHDQTVNLLAEIEHQLRRWDREIANVGAVAVASGPGRFTALRVGMSVAKGLVIAQGALLVGIGSLEAVAWPYLMPGTETIAVVAAGRGRVVWQRFRVESGVPVAMADPENSSFPEMVTALQASNLPLLITGELTTDQSTELEGIAGTTVPPRAGRLGRAGSVAELGYRRVTHGELDDPISLEPVYLHRKRADRTS